MNTVQHREQERGQPCPHFSELRSSRTRPSALLDRADWQSQALCVGFALIYSLVLLWISNQPLNQLYSPSPYHRYQAEALMHGRLSLSDSISAMEPGLAWHNGHVQQVWGLGVGMWLLPFQAVWRLFGGVVFPDRIALGAAFALLALYTVSTGLRMVRSGQGTLGTALMWLILLCPAVWTLARAPRLVFEDTVLYAILLSLGILVSLVRATIFRSRGEYILCSALAAFSILVRPTHAVYGLSAVLVASAIFWRRFGARKLILICNAGWWLSAALLAWSNEVRFGSPVEFGHRLTMSTGSMVYLTRFGNPFKEASAARAGEELFGLLFLNSNVRGANAFANNLFPGQAPFPRWRRLDLSAFDLSWAVVGVAAVAGAIYRLRKPANRNDWASGDRDESELSEQSEPGRMQFCDTADYKSALQDRLVPALLAWSLASFVGLGAFYLYYPAIASRYLLDFAPAMVGIMLLGCSLVAKQWCKVLLASLAIWLVFEVGMAKVPATQGQLAERSTRSGAPDRPAKISRSETTLPKFAGVSLDQFGGFYNQSQHPIGTGIRGNGAGWEKEGGFASDIVTLVVDRPEYVELELSERRGMNGEQARKDTCSAQIDGAWLELRKVQKDEDRIKVRFDVPEIIRARRKDEVLFFCFSTGYDAEDRESERFLYSVRWR